jgi:hypothetical protein
MELLHIGQINLITMFGLFMLFYWGEDSGIISGLGLSLAILTKVSPFLYLGYLVARKKLKTMGYTIGFVILFSFLASLRYGFEATIEYPGVFMELLGKYRFGKNS